MTSQTIRVVLVVLWTAACLGAWAVWTWAGSSGVDASSPAYAEQATGAVVSSACGAGCAGGVWVLGLAVLALLWSLVRR